VSRKTVLVVDDEEKILELVRAYLERDGYNVVTARDGKQALQLADERQPDLVVLDLNLPEVDGLEVCRQIRRSSNTPIIMLTARDDVADRLVGLELGADDYVTKPFSPREVVARVRAVLRRVTTEAAPEERIEVGSLVIDFGRHEALSQGTSLPLSPTEFRLLAALVRSPGRVFSRLQLLDQVQGDAFEGYERTIDAHIKNLRKKLTAAAPEVPCRIVTVRGVGYKLEVDDDA
jgi:DNA-binding response OmpR family regulator